MLALDIATRRNENWGGCNSPPQMKGQQMTLTIRPVRLDDAAELGAIMTDPEVMHGTMRLPLTPER